MNDTITLPQAALRLSRTWHATHRLMLCGELGPAQQISGRWFVSAQGVEAYLERTAAGDISPPGKSQNPKT